MSLTTHVYRLLDFILEKALDSTPLLEAMQRKQSKIDAEYPDTILQIWHCYVLFRHSNDANRSSMITSLKNKHFNPLVATAMVKKKKKQNKELYKIIRDAYKQESGSAQWQSEIMYSKWWLPLFKISRYDSHDYDHFMKSNNFPQLLRIFPAHSEGLE